MKRSFYTAVLLVTTASVLHAAAAAGDSLGKVLDDPLLLSVNEILPEKIEYHLDEEGYGRTAVITDKETIEKAAELLSQITVGSKNPLFVTDCYNWIRVTYENEETSFLRLSEDCLELDEDGTSQNYRLDGIKPFVNMMSEYLTDDEE